MMSFTMSLEYVGPKYRAIFGILIETPFAMGKTKLGLALFFFCRLFISGGLIAGLVSWAGVRDWQSLMLVLSLPNLLLLSLWWLLPESPRWLLVKQKNLEVILRT